MLKKITIDSMRCKSCIGLITKTVEKIPGVNSIEIDLQSKVATLDYQESNTDLAIVYQEIEKNGFQVTEL